MVITFVLLMAACTKSDRANLPEDKGCIDRLVLLVTASSINSSDLQTVDALFRSNSIDNSRFRYFQYVHDSLQTLYAPYAKYDEKTVRVDQYTNGLRIFTGDLVYNFLDNRFHFRGGDLTNGTALNTTPQLTLGQIRKLFLGHIEAFDHVLARYTDSCFKAEFGYYNIHAGISNSKELLVKAWRVTPGNSIYSSEYPMAYFQDDGGGLIYYDNGIRTFK